jgi:RNA polymerase sigma factor (sigma-70 family)
METTETYTITNKSQIADAEVVARVLNGEKNLYELLMRRYNQKLYRVVRSYLKEEHDTEDAMQDTYLLAYQKLYQFRNDASFSTWLIRIGINIAQLMLRKSQYEHATTISDIEDYDCSSNTSLADESNYMNPENITIRNEMKQLLEKAIDSIPEKYRIIYILREVEGMSLREVIQCLNISESNVKIRLHRAKLMLKERLYKLSNGQEVFEFGFKRCDALVEKVLKALPYPNERE